LVCEPNGKTSAEGSDVDDKHESQTCSEQGAAASRSNPKGSCGQDRRVSVRRAVGRMLTRYRRWTAGHGRES
jgi:hypothetical protein